jgi:hypothetical protein
MGPGELARILGLKLVIERLWIVIVDEKKGVANGELVDQFENPFVAVGWH